MGKEGLRDGRGKGMVGNRTRDVHRDDSMRRVGENNG